MPETITFLTVLREGKSPRAGQGLLKLEAEQETGLTCEKNSSGHANQNWGDSDQPQAQLTESVSTQPFKVILWLVATLPVLILSNHCSGSNAR
jgi:hypothetical protein